MRIVCSESHPKNAKLGQREYKLRYVNISSTLGPFYISGTA